MYIKITKEWLNGYYDKIGQTTLNNYYFDRSVKLTFEIKYSKDVGIISDVFAVFM